jgi:PAS domain S-box-containing protein
MTVRDITAEESMSEAMSAFSSMLDTGSVSTELKYIHKDGSIRWWVIDAVKLSANQYLGFAIDTTSKKQAEEELKFQSTRDYLTGLYNRRHYENRAETFG